MVWFVGFPIISVYVVNNQSGVSPIISTLCTPIIISSQNNIPIPTETHNIPSFKLSYVYLFIIFLHLSLFFKYHVLLYSVKSIFPPYFNHYNIFQNQCQVVYFTSPHSHHHNTHWVLSSLYVQNIRGHHPILLSLNILSPLRVYHNKIRYLRQSLSAYNSYMFRYSSFCYSPFN